MDPKRKETLIKEIKYWKKSKLLPEHYCEFLLTLYTEGEGDKQVSSPEGTATFVNKGLLFRFVAVQLSLVIAVLVIYFTDFSTLMQIGVVLLFSTIIFFIAKSTIMTVRTLGIFYFLIGALLLFLLTVQAIVTYTNTNQFMLASAVFVHCGAWVFIGWKWKMMYFTIAGGLGVVILALFWFR
ncbi:hypothetical protein [Bacillus solitudinis]|uniref:hypothetical protein n=1 Tax=Bacillus solitudinis TaxID=2014074 RepID=UPI000C24C0C7|nr:hypothetical protein [Bacillus solitudinis]